MKSEDEKPETKDPEKSKEDEIMERLLKYTQGCTFIMVIVITIIVFLLFFFMN